MAFRNHFPAFDMSQMSEEEFYSKMYYWLQEKGILKEIQGCLRHRMLSTMKEGNMNFSSSKGDESPKVLILNWIIAEHLMRHNYLSTLSLFTCEAPMLKKFSQTTQYQEEFRRLKKKDIEDIMEIFGIPVDSEELKDIFNYYQSENFSLILCILKAYSDKLKQLTGFKEVEKMFEVETVPKKHFTRSESESANRNMFKKSVNFDLESDSRHDTPMEERFLNFLNNIEKKKKAEFDQEISSVKSEFWKGMTEDEERLPGETYKQKRQYQLKYEKLGQEIEQLQRKMNQKLAFFNTELDLEKQENNEMTDNLMSKVEDAKLKLEQLQRAFTEKEGNIKEPQDLESEKRQEEQRRKYQDRERVLQKREEELEEQEKRFYAEKQELQHQGLSLGIQSLHKQLQALNARLQESNKEQKYMQDDIEEQNLASKVRPMDEPLLQKSATEEKLQKAKELLKLYEDERNMAKVSRCTQMSVENLPGKQVTAESRSHDKSISIDRDLYEDRKKIPDYNIILYLNRENKKIKQDIEALQANKTNMRSTLEQNMDLVDKCLIPKKKDLNENEQLPQPSHKSPLAHSDHPHESQMRNSNYQKHNSIIKSLPVNTKQKEMDSTENFIETTKERIKSFDVKAWLADSSRDCQEKMIDTKHK